MFWKFINFFENFKFSSLQRVGNFSIIGSKSSFSERVGSIKFEFWWGALIVRIWLIYDLIDWLDWWIDDLIDSDWFNLSDDDFIEVINWLNWLNWFDLIELIEFIELIDLIELIELIELIDLIELIELIELIDLIDWWIDWIDWLTWLKWLDWLTWLKWLKWLNWLNWLKIIKYISTYTLRRSRRPSEARL